jgi:hypothetical protein
MESLMKLTDGNQNKSLFSHMSLQTKSKSEMIVGDGIAKLRTDSIKSESDSMDSTGDEYNKSPEKKVDVKQCPFNPFGNEDCEACGS